MYHYFLYYILISYSIVLFSSQLLIVMQTIKQVIKTLFLYGDLLFLFISIIRSKILYYNIQINTKFGIHTKLTQSL